VPGVHASDPVSATGALSPLDAVLVESRDLDPAIAWLMRMPLDDRAVESSSAHRITDFLVSVLPATTSRDDIRGVLECHFNVSRRVRNRIAGRVVRRLRAESEESGSGQRMWHALSPPV
jgi:hypothetical protein